VPASCPVALDPADLDWVALRCLICGAPVAGVYYLSRGCAVYSDRIQPLCQQHVISSTPIESFDVIAKRPMPKSATPPCGL